jgi:4-diphosphocytidyl-2-C-methyl-D-erythritol kinase
MDDLRSVFCPAKLNLFLDVNGVRGDRLHELTSLCVRVDLGDWLRISFAESGADEDVLFCDVEGVPTDRSSSILRALDLFRQICPFPQRVKVKLEKNIPIQAGLGGGSSDAAFFLRTLNRMLGQPLDTAELVKLSALVSRDCPLFFGPSPCVVRGSGERVDSVELGPLEGLANAKFLIFKPNFGIETAWAYEIFDRGGSWKCVNPDNSAGSLRILLADLQKTSRSSYFHNAFQSIVCEKFTELGRIFADLPEYFKLRGHLTGTGSAGYIALEEDFDSSPLRKYLVEVLGESALIREVRPILGP